MKLSDRQAAANEVEYFAAKILSIEAAMRRLEEDLKLCKKEQKLWQGRLERAEHSPRRQQVGRGGA